MHVSQKRVWCQSHVDYATGPIQVVESLGFVGRWPQSNKWLYSSKFIFKKTERARFGQCADLWLMSIMLSGNSTPLQPQACAS